QYGEWILGDTNKHARIENKDQKASKDGSVNEYLYNFSAEKSRIYCNIFEYDGFVEFGRIIDKPNKRYDGYVIHGSFIPGQLIQNKSSVFVNFKVTTQDKLTGKKKTLLIQKKDIKSKEIYKDSKLVSVDFYYKLTDGEIKDVKEIIMSSQMDIDGTGKLLVPVDDKKDFRFHLTYGAQAFPEWKYEGNKIVKRTSEGEPPRFKAHEIDAIYSNS
ncbi:MAG: hypothetical protein ACC657_13930, partial [Thiohalomonadales bacterium]